MPKAREWTEAADMTILEMRGQGQTWAEISRKIGVSRNTVIERGHRLRAEAPSIAGKEKLVRHHPNRDPLKAGHPLTWGLLMGGEPYPESYLPRRNPPLPAPTLETLSY